jgi:hypothetical protein
MAFRRKFYKGEFSTLRKLLCSLQHVTNPPDDAFYTVPLRFQTKLNTGQGSSATKFQPVATGHRGLATRAQCDPSEPDRKRKALLGKHPSEGIEAPVHWLFRRPRSAEGTRVSTALMAEMALVSRRHLLGIAMPTRLARRQAED